MNNLVRTPQKKLYTYFTHDTYHTYDTYDAYGTDSTYSGDVIVQVDLQIPTAWWAKILELRQATAECSQKKG